MKKRFWFALPVLALLIMTAVTARNSTPPILDADGEIVPNSIVEERSMLLEDVEQYVLLRGRDRTAPLLVFVHGGPGASETAFLRTYNADLEDDFVVVYWDQRGTGKSFGAELDPSEMTIDQMTADLGELIDQLLEEFNQDQVILVAHSWGTILALEHVASHPETVAAYIAVSQTTSQSESDTAGYEWALTQARTAGDTAAIADLEALGQSPYTLEQFFTQRRYVNQFGGTFYEPRSDLQLLRVAMATSEFAWTDLPNFFKGNRFSGAVLWDEQQNYDARERHASLEVPIFFIVGRHDKVISPELNVEYFDSLDAPKKELIWFEQSGHAPLFEEPEKFNQTVRQIAQQVLDTQE